MTEDEMKDGCRHTYRLKKKNLIERWERRKSGNRNGTKSAGSGKGGGDIGMKTE